MESNSEPTSYLDHFPAKCIYTLSGEQGVLSFFLDLFIVRGSVLFGLVRNGDSRRKETKKFFERKRQIKRKLSRLPLFVGKRDTSD